MRNEYRTCLEDFPDLNYDLIYACAAGPEGILIRNEFRSKWEKAQELVLEERRRETGMVKKETRLHFNNTSRT